MVNNHSAIREYEETKMKSQVFDFLASSQSNGPFFDPVCAMSFRICVFRFSCRRSDAKNTHSKTHFANFVVENMPFVVSFAYRSRISVAAVLSAVGRARNLRSLIALSGKIVFNMPAHIDRKRCLRLSAALFP